MKKEKELLFSVTKEDCDWSYTKGTGSGGQKRNKTSSAVHCTHRESGAKGYSEASRSQLDNKRDAFLKGISFCMFYFLSSVILSAARDDILAAGV
nr:peptide chain release factor-like protein [uncultured Flavobacterium sp.]